MLGGRLLRFLSYPVEGGSFVGEKPYDLVEAGKLQLHLLVVAAALN